MKAMVCEMCGSTELVKQNGMYVCQYCGTKYSVEEAKKLLGSVKIDKSDETEKLLVLARRARNDGNSENAEKYYSLVLQDDPNNWEAAFFQVYYSAMQCKIMNIASAAYSVANCINGTIQLITEIEDRMEKDEAISTITVNVALIANLLGGAAENHFNQYPTVDGAFAECVERVCAAETIFAKTETALKHYFPDNKKRLVELQKTYNAYVSSYGKYFNADYRNRTTARLAEEIKEHDEEYVAPTVNTGGCYVATAVYGSYDCPQVWTLRRFRDFTLAETWYGRAFIRTYYAISPTLVKWFGDTEWFKNLWKPTLDRMVDKLNSNGVSNKPYNDYPW